MNRLNGKGSRRLEGYIKGLIGEKEPSSSILFYLFLKSQDVLGFLKTPAQTAIQALKK